MTSRFSFSRTVASEEGVYGLILVAGLIAASGSTSTPAWKTLVFTGVTVVVFWIAHVYAGAVAEHGSRSASGGHVRLSEAVGGAIRKSHGLLSATLPPAAALVLGVVGILPDVAARWVALWVCVSVLAVLGYLAYARKGATVWVRLLGAVSTASFGVVIIIAKAIVTH